jgi:hypothetical protein
LGAYGPPFTEISSVYESDKKGSVVKNRQEKIEVQSETIREKVARQMQHG